MECKSLVMGLAYFSRHISLDQLKVAARLEEEFQVEIWGLVEGGHDIDRLNNSISLSASGMFLDCLYADRKAYEGLMQKWKSTS